MRRERKTSEHQKPPSYELLYLAVHLDENAETLASTEEIAQQMDDIRTLTDAIEEMDGHVSTYSSA